MKFKEKLYNKIQTMGEPCINQNTGFPVKLNKSGWKRKKELTSRVCRKQDDKQ